MTSQIEDILNAAPVIPVLVVLVHRNPCALNSTRRQKKHDGVRTTCDNGIAGKNNKEHDRYPIHRTHAGKEHSELRDPQHRGSVEEMLLPIRRLLGQRLAVHSFTG